MTWSPTPFAYTGAAQTHVVAGGGTRYLRLVCMGSAGGSPVNSPGYGAKVTAYAALAAGTSIQVNCGGRTFGGSAGGWNGGGTGGANANGGGGATDMRIGGTALSNRVIVAGGGGGNGENVVEKPGVGGNGGPVSGNGEDGSNHPTSGTGVGGAGGTQSAGGNKAGAGSAGALGVGGAGSGGYAGGGGGGYYGGQGGLGSTSTSGAGGGGGSSFLSSASSYVLKESVTGANSQAGIAGIDYFTATAPTLTVATPQATGVPTASATFQMFSPVPGDQLRVQFDLATNNTFTAGLVTTYSPYVASGIDEAINYFTGPIALGAPNTQGTYYVRARLVSNNANFPTSPYTSTYTMVVAHKPVATVVKPTAGNHILYSTTFTPTWTQTDPWGADTITNYQVVVENNTTNALIYDSGTKAIGTFGVTGSLGQQTASIASVFTTAHKNIALRWKVRVQDTSGTWSDYSAAAVFQLQDPVAVTITAPAVASSQTTPSPQMTWTFPGGAQPNNVGSLIVRYRDTATNTVVWSRSFIPYNGQLTINPNSPVLVNGRSYTAELIYTDQWGIVTNVSNAFTVSYVVPNPLPYTIDATQVDTLGPVIIDWSFSTSASSFVRWSVYRKLLPLGNWEKIADIASDGTRTYQDFAVLAGRTYQYSVTQVTVQAGNEVESPVGYYWNGSASVAEDRTFLIDTSYFWLISTTYAGFAYRLPGVTEHSETEEYEAASYGVVGRGRHRDQGTRYGYVGTLTVKVRDVERPSTTRMQIEALRAAQDTYLLRSPFGKLFKVALGDIGWTAVAGVGTSEMGDLTLPYEEVA